MTSGLDALPLDPFGPPAVGAASSICEGYAVPGSCHGNGTTTTAPGAGVGLAQSSRMNRPRSPSAGSSSPREARGGGDGGARSCGSARTRSSMDASASSKKENHAFLERMHATMTPLECPSPSYSRAGAMRRQNPVVLLPSPSVSENVYVSGGAAGSSPIASERSRSGKAKFLVCTVATSSQSCVVPSPPSAP